MAWQYAAMAGFQVISGLQQAEMVRTQAEIQKQIDEFNAQMSEFDAWRVIGYGQTQMAQYQQQIDQTMAAGKVTAAAAGVSTTEGSIAELTAQTELTGAMNLLEIENQTREKALGYTRQARQIRMGSQMNQMTAATQAASVIGGSVLKGAGILAAGYIKSPSPSSKPTGSESGYSLPRLESTPGSYLTGTSEDIVKTGYLGLP